MKAYRCRRRFIAGKSAITVIPRLHGNISLGVFWCGAFAIEIFERCLWFWGMFFIVNKSAIRVTPSLPVYIRLEVFLPFFQGTFFPGLDYIVLLPLSSEVLLLSFKSTVFISGSMVAEHQIRDVRGVTILKTPRRPLIVLTVGAFWLGVFAIEIFKSSRWSKECSSVWKSSLL